MISCMQLRIIIFNILIVFFLLVTAIFPVSLLGKDVSADYFRTVWPLILVVLAALCGVDVYFFRNRQFFGLMEKGDWKGLAAYLKGKVYGEGRYTSRNVRFLAQSCLLLGDLAAVAELETKTEEKKPSLVDDNALTFGISRILAVGSSRENAIDNYASSFFQKVLEREKPSAMQNSEWVHWFYGFSLVFAKSFDKAGEVLGNLAVSARDGVVAGLSAYFLLQIMGQQPSAAGDLYSKAGEGRNRALKSLKSADKWRKKSEKLRSEVHGALISKYLEEACTWLYKGEPVDAKS